MPCKNKAEYSTIRSKFAVLTSIFNSLLALKQNTKNSDLHICYFQKELLCILILAWKEKRVFNAPERTRLDWIKEKTRSLDSVDL